MTEGAELIVVLAPPLAAFLLDFCEDDDAAARLVLIASRKACPTFSCELWIQQHGDFETSVNNLDGIVSFGHRDLLLLIYLPL